MKLVKLGLGAVAFETQGAGDRIRDLDTEELRRSGWTEQAIENYQRYRLGADILRQAPSPAGSDDAATSD